MYKHHRADVCLDGARLCGSHTLQHLDVEGIGAAALFGQQVGQRHVEQVVAGHTQPDHRSRVRTQRPLNEANVVRVHVLFGGVRRLLPAMQLRVHLLHREVGALDDPDLERRPALPGTLMGELEHALQRG